MTKRTKLRDRAEKAVRAVQDSVDLDDWDEITEVTQPQIVVQVPPQSRDSSPPGPWGRRVKIIAALLMALATAAAVVIQAWRSSGTSSQAPAGQHSRR